MAEHRHRTTEAILDAAEQLLIQDESPLTLAAVGEKVGLRRPSLYRYYANLDELVEAVAIRNFPRWTDAVRVAVEAAGDPQEAVAAYVRANLTEAVSSRHEWRVGLARLHLRDESRRRIGAMHIELTEILRDAVRRIPGVRHDLCVIAVQALTDAGVSQIATVPAAAREDLLHWYPDAARRVIG